MEDKKAKKIFLLLSKMNDEILNIYKEILNITPKDFFQNRKNDSDVNVYYSIVRHIEVFSGRLREDLVYLKHDRKY